MSKKKKWTWGAFLASIALASGIAVATPEENTPEPEAAVPSAPASPAPIATPQGFEVDRVIDGDTVKILTDSGSKTVRIVGIDTPETVHPRMDVECYGPEASARAKELLEGQTVQLEQDLSQGETDRYGRYLGYLTLEDGRDFGRVMIEEGYAEEVTYDGWYEKQGRYKFYEDVAREQGVGQWAAC